MPETRNSIDARPSRVRSKVTNGRSLFVAGGDGRGPWARRARDVMQLHISDLGGEDHISEAEKSICRRIAVLTVECERMEARFATDEPSEKALDLYQRMSGALRRLYEAIGLQRRAKPIETLAEYLASKAAEPAADSLDDDEPAAEAGAQ